MLDEIFLLPRQDSPYEVCDVIVSLSLPVVEDGIVFEASADLLREVTADLCAVSASVLQGADGLG